MSKSGTKSVNRGYLPTAILKATRTVENEVVRSISILGERSFAYGKYPLGGVRSALSLSLSLSLCPTELCFFLRFSSVCAFC